MRKVEFKGPHGRALSYKVLQKYENMSRNIVSLLSQRNKIFSTQISQELLILRSDAADDCSSRAGLEHLQTDLCRALGRVHPCPPSLQDALLCWPRGQDARMRGSGPDGVYRVSVSPVWGGHPSHRHELQIFTVFTLRQSLRGYLGQPGESHAA